MSARYTALAAIAVAGSIGSFSAMAAPVQAASPAALVGDLQSVQYYGDGYGYEDRRREEWRRRRWMEERMRREEWRRERWREERRRRDFYGE